MARLAQAWALLCLLGSVVGATPAADAEKHFQAGYRAYHANDYAGAIREFEAASALHASPILDYNIGAAYEKLGRPADAARYLRRYLETAPQAANRADIEKRIAALTAPPPPPPPTEPAEPPKPAEPECPAGKVPASGHCCWPGQTYDADDGRCAGEPQCPEPLESFEENCRAKPKPPPPKPKPFVLQPPAPSEPVRVAFFPRKAAAGYEVRVGDRACQTPCELKLVPGRSHVLVDGSGRFEQDLYVPARAVRVQVEHISRRAMVAGAILLPAGLLATVVALAAMVASGTTAGVLTAIAFIPFTTGIMTTGAILLGKAGGNALTVVGGLDAKQRAATAGIGITF